MDGEHRRAVCGDGGHGGPSGLFSGRVSLSLKDNIGWWMGGGSTFKSLASLGTFTKLSLAEIMCVWGVMGDGTGRTGPLLPQGWRQVMADFL